jgi:hypothetical protein
MILLGSACTAPLVEDDGAAGPAVLDSLGDAQAVEIATPSGPVLRGAFLEAAPDAPVVLHLLPTGASTRTGVPGGVGRVALDGALEALRQLGWSSLVVDYRGVGSSDGERSPRLLGEDGHAMWQEAVQRAGGAPERVVIRATSLGTLVAADLLLSETLSEDQAAGALLFAPIDAATIVPNAARFRYGALAGWWAGWTHRSPDFPEVVEAVASTGPPMLIVLPAQDPYLPPEEAARVRETAAAAGQRVETLDGEHARTVLRAWNFDVDVDGFGGRRVPQLLDAEVSFLRGLGLPAAGR